MESSSRVKQSIGILTFSILCILFGAFFLTRISCFKKVSSNIVSLSIQNMDNQIVYNKNGFQLVFQRQGYFSGSFLTFGGFVDRKNMPFDGNMEAISWPKVFPLYEKHPDFLKCSSPGKSEVMNAIENITLYAATPEARRQINEALVFDPDRIYHPTIKIQGALLEEVEFTHDGTHLTIQNPTSHILVELIERIDSPPTL
jgi:hypothetical protein